MCENKHRCIWSLYNMKHVAGDIERIIDSLRLYAPKGYLDTTDVYLVPQKVTVYHLANRYRRPWLTRDWTEPLCGGQRLQSHWQLLQLLALEALETLEALVLTACVRVYVLKTSREQG